jgi:tight adherence protein C
LVYLIYLLILVSAALAGLSLSLAFRKKTLPALNLDRTEYRRVNRPIFLGPLTLMHKPLVDRFGRQKLENKLSAARIKLMPEEYLVLKEIFLVLSLGVFYFVLKDILGRVEIIWLVVFAGIVFLFPDLWLNTRFKIRQGNVIRVLPDVIDLLSLCVNAGLDFGVAVEWVVNKSKSNPLIEELNLFLIETKMGKSRRQALRDLAKRVDLPEVSSFTRTLIQTERLGTPVESALAILSEEVRDFRFRRGERLALQAPIKLLFPLIFFIMPVVGIIVGGPVLLQFLQGGISLSPFK